MKRSRFGGMPQFGSLRGAGLGQGPSQLGRVRGVGQIVPDTLSATERDGLAQTADRLGQALDTLILRINTAADSGTIDQSTLDAWLAERDSIDAALIRLLDRLDGLAPTDVQAWRDELARLTAQASNLELQIAGGTSSASSSRLWKIGIWTGLSIIGAIGLLFLVRRYMKKHHPRRLRA